MGVAALRSVRNARKVEEAEDSGSDGRRRWSHRPKESNRHLGESFGCINLAFFSHNIILTWCI